MRSVHAHFHLRHGGFIHALRQPLIPAFALLFFAGAAAPRTGHVCQPGEFFSVNLPAEPTSSDAPYKTVKGTI